MLEVYKEAGLSSEQPVFMPSGDHEIIAKIFDDIKNNSEKEYLMQYRMKSAMKLMEDPALSIQYISFAVGYNDIFTFSKAFKKHVGQSPSEYRKSIM